MKIVCSKNLLVDGLLVVARAAATRSSMPILECCLLTASDDGLKITANDMDLAIETNFIESDILSSGQIALDIKMFTDIVRGLPGPQVEISSDDKFLTTIKSGKSEFKILGMNPEDFPSLPEVSKKQMFKISSSGLKNMIRQTVFSVSQDTTKPVLGGQLMDISGESLKIVSVDGFRISLRESVLDDADEDKNLKIVIPGKTMDEVSKILPTDADVITTFYATDKHVLFEMDNCTVVSRLLEGEFINYENMFTSDVTTMITAARAEILESISRAILISRDTKKNPVKLGISGSVLSINCNTELGTSHEEMTVLQDGPDLEIAFNPKYLTDVFKTLDAENITISFTSSLSPCIIRVEGSEDYKYLVLPLRLRG